MLHVLQPLLDQEIVEEQTALRRVAALVARGVSQDALLRAVTAEIAGLVGADAAAMLRFEPGDTATLVAGWSKRHRRFPVGRRRPVTATLLAVRDGGRPAQFAPSELPLHDLSVAIGVPIAVDGRVWGLSLAAWSRRRPLPDDTAERIAGFTELVAAAIGNAERRAELTASRARLVATADATRRRIQRDLHDGAQQRLVHTVLTLKLVRDALGGREAALVDQALRHAEQATAELRDLVHGILPAALTHGGLRAGIESLCVEVDLPVELDVCAERLPATVEATAYFVVAEALTNAVKHAGAARAHVRAHAAGGVLRLEVRDDGDGGADPARGTGLIGLADRVATCGGAIAVTSPAGAGTTVAAHIPINRKGPS